MRGMQGLVARPAGQPTHAQCSGWGACLLSREASARPTFSRPPLLILPDRAGTASVEDSRAPLHGPQGKQLSSTASCDCFGAGECASRQAAGSRAANTRKAGQPSRVAPSNAFRAERQPRNVLDGGEACARLRAKEQRRGARDDGGGHAGARQPGVAAVAACIRAEDGAARRRELRRRGAVV